MNLRFEGINWVLMVEMDVLSFFWVVFVRYSVIIIG